LELRVWVRGLGFGAPSLGMRVEAVGFRGDMHPRHTTDIQSRRGFIMNTVPPQGIGAVSMLLKERPQFPKGNRIDNECSSGCNYIFVRRGRLHVGDPLHRVGDCLAHLLLSYTSILGDI